MRARLSLVLLAFLVVGSAAAQRPMAPGSASVRRCDRFVYMQNGGFKLAGQPFPLKSVNYRVEIVGREVAANAPTVPGAPRVVVEGKALDLFLAPYGSYSPDNNSWCRDPREWNAQMRCCDDRTSCAVDLAADVARVNALGVNSVRLLMDTFKIRNGVPTFGIGRMPWVWRDFFLDLRDPTHLAAVYLLHKQAVQFLGARGIRSLALLNGAAYFRDQPTWNAAFTSFAAGLATTMRDEPWFLGFDFYNEPTWASGAPAGTKFEIDKKGARDLVRTWTAAVRQAGGNQTALLTIGNAYALTSVEAWDPAYLPIDFASYHIYPPVPTPAASRAFIERETFYAALGACAPGGAACGGGRMPALIGEYGASVHEVNATTGAVTKATHGDAANQAAYLTAVGARAHACGYQGVQWWQHADVHWGDATQDHFGLWGDFRQVRPGQPVPEPDAMAMRPAGEALRALDLYKPRAACPAPADWNAPMFAPGVSGARFRYRGRVFDQHLRAVPYAMLSARLTGNKDVFFTAHADAKGTYDFKTPRLVERIRATHFGHETTRWHIPVPLLPTLIRLKAAAANDLPAYAPPSRDLEACRDVVY